MLNIVPYKQDYFPVLVSFVAAIQEHERQAVPELKSGNEIGEDYANLLVQKSGSRNGVILMARISDDAIGFVCSWADADEDPLLRDDVRDHAYISDMFVTEAWRGQKVAQALLKEVEIIMRQRGYNRMRICSKATNMQAVGFYQSSGFKPYEITFSKEL